MGYLVGRVCYETHAEATNHVMTHVVPTIDKDGVLHHPVFNGNAWIFNQQTVQLTFPECDPLQYFNHGKTIGTGVVSLMLALFAIVVSKRVILDQKDLGSDQ